MTNKNMLDDLKDIGTIMDQSEAQSISAKGSNFSVNTRVTHQIKIILLGDIAVGKTALFTRYIDNTFTDEYKCTISTEFRAKSINLEANVNAQLEIWDTCGEEKYRSLTRQYYRKSQGMILLFDLTNRSSFSNLPSWLNDIKANADSECEKIIVGNKSDLENARQVTKKEAEIFANDNGFNYFEISAKAGINIEPLFEQLAKAIAKKLKEKASKNLNEKSHETLLKEKELEERLREQDKKRSVGCCK